MLRLLCLQLFIVLCNSLNVDVWGPGLAPDKIVLPARYFFISFIDDKSVSIKSSDLSVDIKGISQSGSCRLWLDKLDRKNGSFIIRYRLYETCDNFEINLKYKQKHIADSPYLFKGPIYHEGCDCPDEDFTHWAENYGCPKSIEQINLDMKRFKDVNMSHVYNVAIDNFNHPGSISLCYYVIKNNQLYRKCMGKHVGFNMFSDNMLLSILRKVVLPDQSFFINLGDWPLVKKNMKSPIPIFSWCGSEDTYDMVLPTHDITESTMENLGRVMLDMLSVQGNIEKSWDEKTPQAFWRGRDSRLERLHLIDIARKNPDLFNASLTNFFFFRDKENYYGPKTPHVSFFKFFDYKYQINIDGTVASYRFPYLLVGDSLVFKQESPYYEHFYRHVKPGKHFVSFKRDLSDLTEKLRWAIEHDSEARTIAENGKEFARNNLMPKDIICYYAVALNKWSTRLSIPIANVESMEKISQNSEDRNCECFKTFKNNVKEEL